MKLAQLAFFVVLAAACVSSPSVTRAEMDGPDGNEEGMEAPNRDRHDEGEGRNKRRAHHDSDPVMKEKFEKVRELERTVHLIAEKVRQGPDSERLSAKEEARKVIGELFDAKLALETAMLEKLEKNAAELKAKIAKKKSNRDKAIESRLARVIGEGDEWE